MSAKAFEIESVEVYEVQGHYNLCAPSETQYSLCIRWTIDGKRYAISQTFDEAQDVEHCLESTLDTIEGKIDAAWILTSREIDKKNIKFIRDRLETFLEAEHKSDLAKAQRTRDALDERIARSKKGLASIDKSDDAPITQDSLNEIDRDLWREAIRREARS